MYENMKKLVANSNLGSKVIEISKVTGGLSHKMYKVTTDKGNYAIKELNPNIMQRPEAYSNFVFSEKVTDIAKENGISAIGAVKIDGNIIQQIDNDYFMIFDWVDGKVLKAEEITKEHSKVIAKILAEIHNIDFSEIEDENRKKIILKDFDWKKYLQKAEQENKEYSKLLKDNSDLLYELNRKSKKAMLYANNNLAISHKDLDRKNVIWQGNVPFIIDWEASGYVNLTIELIVTAWYWAGGDLNSLDYDKFKIFIQTYKKYYKGNIDINIDRLVYADLYSGLEWIDYNLQRALGINIKCPEDEVELAENEIVSSIEEIKYNVSQLDKMVEIIRNS